MTEHNPLQIKLIRLYYRGHREDILNFLSSNDPNGCYTDDQCAMEELPALDMVMARKYLSKLIWGNE